MRGENNCLKWKLKKEHYVYKDVHKCIEAVVNFKFTKNHDITNRILIFIDTYPKLHYKLVFIMVRGKILCIRWNGMFKDVMFGWGRYYASVTARPVGFLVLFTLEVLKGYQKLCTIFYMVIG